jgi:predicted unusual protein kinase regulating ubiquinone biosynthesis (AarF/ABC1/UbiB family)
LSAGGANRTARLPALRALAVAAAVLRHGLLPLLLPPARRTPGPVRLRRALEALGGAWIKLGQLLALRFDLLPERYCLELFDLLGAVAPFPFAEVEGIVHEDLGHAVDELLLRSRASRSAAPPSARSTPPCCTTDAAWR